MTETERFFRVMPIGARYQVQHSTPDGGRWVWAVRNTHETPQKALAEARSLARRWRGKPGNVGRVLSLRSTTPADNPPKPRP